MIFAWLGALFIGLSLGLLGSGGSIMTVPVLVYLVGQDPKVAIAGSLLIVGIISLFSAVGYARKQLVKWHTVVMFGVPGMAGAFAGAWAAHFVAAEIQMLLFAILLVSASFLMFKPVDLDGCDQPHKERALYKIAMDGILVGAVTGLVGVGGGFMIIPALVLLGGLSMRLAVGTSLVIICINSFVAFAEHLRVLEALNLSLDWTIILIFSLIGVAGAWVGQYLSSKVNQMVLKKGFAIFLVMMGTFILYKNLPSIF